MTNRHDLALDEDAIFEVARAESGCLSVEDDTLRDRVGHFVAMYRAAARSAADERAAAETLVDVLATRLAIDEDRRRHPEIADEPIERPVIVGGFGRSGTTHLYSLLAADPAARSPHWWDALHPSPPPGLSPDHDRLRRQISKSAFEKDSQGGHGVIHGASDQRREPTPDAEEEAACEAALRH